MGLQEKRRASTERVLLLTLLLLALVVRLWLLDGQGLAYDEAATALMARPDPLAIIHFHWQAAYEHPPLWQLLMHFWSRLAGQSEYALRFLPALAGVVQVVLIWQVGRGLQPALQTHFFSIPWLAALLVTLMPVLVHYSQEARMYSLVVALALTSLGAVERLVARPALKNTLIFAATIWLMTGLHYYSILLVMAEGLWAVWVLRASRAPGRVWMGVATGMGLAVAPLAFWLLVAPGFHATLRSILSGGSEGQPGVGMFLDGLWRELSFGAIRWAPDHNWLGYLLTPIVVCGVGTLVLMSLPWLHESRLGETTSIQSNASWALLVLLLLLVPTLVSALWFRTLATRYVLFLAPLLCLLIALGVAWLAGIDWRLGGLWLTVALLVMTGGLLYYFTGYTKSDYRAMAQTLTEQFDPTEGILLEAPRQHLLAKYYFPPGYTYYTAPHVELPDFWPVNAPPVIPEKMDDRIQAYLRRHPALWLILSAEDEVDKGEFIPKYLTAVSFRQECQAWLDVRLCRFVSPHYTNPDLVVTTEQQFDGALTLTAADLSTMAARAGGHVLLVTLFWLAETQPAADYRVTLRLLTADGVTTNQLDDFPIGPLLPPSTWNAGDAKPGYMALPLSPDLRPGTYEIAVGLYDPVTQQLLAHSNEGRSQATGLLTLGVLEHKNGALTLHAPPTGRTD